MADLKRRRDSRPRLLGSPLKLHDVRDVEAHVRVLLDARLREWGARLRPAEYEDALGYLIAKCWELSRIYDSTHGLSFSTFSRRILTNRVVDWYRTTYGDTRYDTHRQHTSLEALASMWQRDDDFASDAYERLIPGVRPGTTVEPTDPEAEEVLTNVALGL